MLYATGRVAKAAVRQFVGKDGQPGESGQFVLIDVDDPTSGIRVDCRKDDLPADGDLVTVRVFVRAQSGPRGPWASYWASSLERVGASV